jgi:hypothetical protein
VASSWKKLGEDFKSTEIERSIGCGSHFCEILLLGCLHLRNSGNCKSALARDCAVSGNRYATDIAIAGKRAPTGFCFALSAATVETH